MATTKRRGQGRPPAGTAHDGTPEKVSEYGRLTLIMRPAARAMLESMSMLTGQPAWRIVDEALRRHVTTLNPEDRKAVEAMAAAIEKRQAK